MAALDPYLRALVLNDMDVLVLEPGERPRLRKGETEHRISRAELDRDQIGALLDELGEGDRFGCEGEPGDVREILHRWDDKVFRVVATRRSDGWSAVALRSSESVGAPAARDPDAPPSVSLAEQPAPGALGAAQKRRAGTLDELLRHMIEREASDLHLSTGQPPRLRVHGELIEIQHYEPPGAAEIEEMLEAITPQRNREQFIESGDTDFGYEMSDRARFRINLFRDRLGPGAVVRTIPIAPPSFDELGLPEILRDIANLRKGLILVTGATGSGKSTTLAAIVDLLNRERQDHIITIEDPIEFVHRSRRCMVNQREVGVHTPSFRQALRAALREDPDIILVGEMRDLETTSTAIETAETGHLVFGTLHTTTAPSTVERLIDQFPADRQAQIRVMLAGSLHAVVSQVLLRRKEGGRVGAFEVLVATPAISNLIRENKTFQIASAMQTGRGIGMRLLNDHLLELVRAGTVEPLEAYRHSRDREALTVKLQAEGLAPDQG